MKVCGLDEAGRGPVLGPLVVAGVAVADPDLPGTLGCTDSKLLSPDKRRALRGHDGVRIAIRALEAEELDRRRKARETLNDIEVQAFQEIATELGAPTVIVDAAHPDAKRFARLLKPGLPKGTRIVSEHKADLNHAVVGAASIVAKVARDAAIERLARRLERRVAMPLGSGYPSDPLTRGFLEAWWKEHKAWPEGTRTTWTTLKDIAAPKPVPLEAFGSPDPATSAASTAVDPFDATL